MKLLRPVFATLFACGLMAGTFGLVPQPALACGGLFCQRTPVDQAGEKILFASDGQTITAHVQIQYQGEAKDFSWIVPVPSEPKLGVGSDALFTSLRAATRPTFSYTVRDEGKCKEENKGFSSRGTAPMSAPQGMAMESRPGAIPGVTVVSQEQVGAFASAVIQSNDPGALKAWLRENEYTIPDKLDPLLDPYVAGKYYFVALKLTKDADVGDIAPIVLTYAATKPGIPIRLTGIAATDNMDVYVWMLGKDRAIPENYRHAQINEMRLNWPAQGSNYRQVVIDAMNEAGGQAWVTDYAGKSNAVQLSDPMSLDAFKEQTEPLEFYQTVVSRRFFPQQASLIAFLKRYIPKPESLKGVNDQNFYANLANYKDEIVAAQITVDSAAAVKELDERFVTPQREIKALFAKHPYLTQLYTAMSPEEMTQDPLFIYNKDLPDVSGSHVAKGVRLCSSGYTYREAPIRITLANGISYMTPGDAGPKGEGKPVKMPAAGRIEQLKGSGGASTIQDNRSAIVAASVGSLLSIDGSGGMLSFTPLAPGRVAVDAPESGFACASCSVGNTPPPPGNKWNSMGDGVTYALFVVGWFGYRRWTGKKG